MQNLEILVLCQRKQSTNLSQNNTIINYKNGINKYIKKVYPNLNIKYSFLVDCNVLENGSECADYIMEFNPENTETINFINNHLKFYDIIIFHTCPTPFFNPFTIYGVSLVLKNSGQLYMLSFFPTDEVLSYDTLQTYQNHNFVNEKDTVTDIDFYNGPTGLVKNKDIENIKIKYFSQWDLILRHALISMFSWKQINNIPFLELDNKKLNNGNYLAILVVYLCQMFRNFTELKLNDYKNLFKILPEKVQLFFSQSAMYSLENKKGNSPVANTILRISETVLVGKQTSKPTSKQVTKSEIKQLNIIETTVSNVKVQYIRPKYNDLKKWSEDPNNVYIARKGVVFVIDKQGDKMRYPKYDSIWANPYKVDKDGTRQQVLEKYRKYIVNKIEKENLYEELENLRGKNLGCWCKPEACHGDILVELLNNLEEQKETEENIKESEEVESYVPGLYYVENVISQEYENELLNFINNSEWSDTLKRRVQHYGYLYKYTRGKNTDQSIVKPVPEWLLDLFVNIRTVVDIPEFDIQNLQVIINEYKPGQGIAAHIDDPRLFDNWIISVNLGSYTIVKFTEKSTGKIIEKEIKQRSLYCMTEDARYNWTHEIPARKTDTINGVPHKRGTRISVTFRAVKN